MLLVKSWQWIVAVILGVGFFVVFSAGYGLWAYLHPPKIVSAVSPADFGLPFEEVAIETRDKIKLAAWYIPAEQISSKAILLLHGYPADKGDILPAMRFLQRDYHLLFLDFRYFGQSEGGYSTIGVREIQDVLAGVAYLKERGAQALGVWGFSMGAAAALMTLPESEEVDAIVSDSSYARLDLMAEEVYRELPKLNEAIAWLMSKAVRVSLGIDLLSQSPLSAVANAEVPILFIHSRADEVIPFAQAELLQAVAAHNDKAEFWFRESASHGSLGTVEYNERVQGFFDQHL